MSVNGRPSWKGKSRWSQSIVPVGWWNVLHRPAFQQPPPCTDDDRCTDVCLRRASVRCAPASRRDSNPHCDRQRHSISHVWALCPFVLLLAGLCFHGGAAVCGVRVFLPSSFLCCDCMGVIFGRRHCLFVFFSKPILGLSRVHLCVCSCMLEKVCVSPNRCMCLWVYVW